jgi:hypothetical protein
VVVVDPEELEIGITELLPVVRKPRWTPEIGPIPGPLAARPAGTRAPEPSRAVTEEVDPGDAGEVILLDQRRRSVS